MTTTRDSREPLGDWFRREVRPRLTVELVYGEARWKRVGAWRARPCPLHNGDRDSFHVHPETLGWKCHSECQAEGDVAGFIQRAHGVDFVGAVRHLAALVGEVLPGDATTSTAPRPPRPPPPPPPAKPAPTRLPRAEVAGLWNAARPVTSDAAATAHLAARAIAPELVEERDLARVLPPDLALPTWASRRDGPWTTTGHRLLLPLYGATGGLESVRARLVRPPRDAKELKALAATGASVGGLVLADALGRAMLEGAPHAAELVARAGVWIAEGEPDFLTLATEWGDGAEDAPAVLGVVSGSWTKALADRVPDGARVVLAVDGDGAGEKYAADIRRTFAERMRSGRITLKRWRARA